MHTSSTPSGRRFVRALPSGQFRRLLLLVALLLSGAAGQLGATVNGYLLSVSTSKPFDMSEARQVKIADDMTVGPFDMGFNFNFDGTEYSTFTIGSNGLLGLGKSPVISTGDNTQNPDVPCLMPFWDGFSINAAYFQVSGTEPNRTLTVQWEGYPQAVKGYVMFQARLTEGSNTIEFYYGQWLGKIWSGTVGLWVDESNFATVTTSENQFNYLKRDDENFPAPEGTVYTFTPNLCSYTITGDVAQGGTETMEDGDVLLAGVSAPLDRDATRLPFTLAKSSSCGTKAATFEINGEAAKEYSVKESLEFPATPEITFTPTSVGVRPATLTVTAGEFVRTYQLAAVGGSRVALNGDPAQGGTTPLASGDTLLQPLFVNGGTCDSRSPIVLQNVGLMASGATLTISGSNEYTLPGGGKIELKPGESVAPEIRFCPSDTARRPALLTVTTDDGETMTYVLYAFGRYRAIQMMIDGVPADASTETFGNQTLCVGGDIRTIAVDLNAYGDVPVNVNAIRFYEADTIVRQGFPAYPLRFNQFGKPIPMSDYIVTTVPPVLPVEANTPASYPVMVPGGGTTRLYVSFIANRPGKRFGRIFIETDAINLSNVGPDNKPALGLLRFDLYGRGVGSILSDNASGAHPQTTVFAPTPLGVETVRWVRIENPGACELKIGTADLAPSAGDVHEFRIDSIPTSWVTDADGANYLLAPGTADSIRVAFRPIHLGTRRASILLRTNDSTLALPGNRRGEYYIDLEGVGGEILYSNSAHLGDGMIDDAAGPYNKGVIRLVNGTATPRTVTNVVLLGQDAASFQLTGVSPINVTIAPGQETEQTIEFRPVGGAPGERAVEIGWIVENGDTIRSVIRGTAGTRVAAANQTLITFVPTRVGRISRRLVAITNQGTLPVHLQQPVVGGADASLFTASTLPRLTLAPGQVEFVEITFAPSSTGPAVGNVTVGTDASAGAIVVSLNGAGTQARYSGDEDPAGAVLGDDGGRDEAGNGVEFGVAGVAESREVKGVQIVPNPVRSEVIVVKFEGSGAGRVDLYNAQGRSVHAGEIQGVGGECVLRVPGLPSGRYTLRLQIGEKVSNRTVVVER